MTWLISLTRYWGGGQRVERAFTLLTEASVPVNSGARTAAGKRGALIRWNRRRLRREALPFLRGTEKVSMRRADRAQGYRLTPLTRARPSLSLAHETVWIALVYMML